MIYCLLLYFPFILVRDIGFEVETEKPAAIFLPHSSEPHLAAQSHGLDVAVTEVKARASLKELGRSVGQCTPRSTRQMYSCFKIQNPATLIFCPISDIILLPRTHQHNKRRNIPMFCRQCFCLYSLGDDIFVIFMFDLGFSILSPLKNAIQPVMLHSVFVWLLTPGYLSTLSLLNSSFSYQNTSLIC